MRLIAPEEVCIKGQAIIQNSRVHEKALSPTDMVCGPWKLSGPGKRDQSLFSLLLEIEIRLRTKGRNDQIEQLRRSREKDRQRPRVNNLSRYCE